MKTAIQWTDDVWNPVVGCTKVSQGCKNCYAKTLHDQRHKAKLAGKAMPEQYREPFETVQLMPERLDAPLRWRRPRKVFVNSMSDLFHEQVPDEFIDRVFATMALTPQHTYQILTKRPERMQEYVGHATTAGRVWYHWMQLGRAKECLADRSLSGNLRWPLPNVWLGVSVEDQRRADERIPLLLASPAAVRFLSCEPLLEEVHLLKRWTVGPCSCYSGRNPHPDCIDDNEQWGTIDWVIVGGESGNGARECDVAWIRRLVAQCRDAGVAPFVKQLGANVRDRNDAGFDADENIAGSWPMGTKHNVSAGYQGAPVRVFLRHSHGGDWDEWPADLRVREFPNANAS